MYLHLFRRRSSNCTRKKKKLLSYRNTLCVNEQNSCKQTFNRLNEWYSCCDESYQMVRWVDNCINATTYCYTNAQFNDISLKAAQTAGFVDLLFLFSQCTFRTFNREWAEFTCRVTLDICICEIYTYHVYTLQFDANVRKLQSTWRV